MSFRTAAQLAVENELHRVDERAGEADIGKGDAVSDEEGAQREVRVNVLERVDELILCSSVSSLASCQPRT